MDLEITQRLSDRRRSAGLSQEELADRLGVSRQAVSNWERGLSSPDTENLLALARVYGTSVDWLLTGRSVETQAAAGESEEQRKRPWFTAAVTAGVMAFSIFFYTQVASWLAISVMDDVTEIFALEIGTTLALLWFATEVILVALPMWLAAVVARKMGWNVALTAATPAIAYAALALWPAALNAAFGLPQQPFTGMGALSGSVNWKADLIGAAAGMAVAYMLRRRATQQRAL